ncbi:TPA: hypothetical protein ACKRYN_000070 [Pseudomonas aeruginosa]
MTESKICTCPSGDGSLRWPCPAHPAVEQAGGDERAEFERAFTVQEGVFFDDKRGEYRSMNLREIEVTDAQDLNLRLQGWQARAALAQPSPAQAEAERPEVVGYLATAEHPKHGQPHKAFNYFKDQHDAQVAHWRERGCEVSEDELMTVTQHARIVGALRADRDSWAEQAEQRLADWDEMRKERDAALARVAELETALEPFAAVADAYDDSEDDDHEPYTDMGCDDRLRLTLGQHRAGRIALEGRTPQAQTQHSAGYAEARQCVNCRHIGINDAADYAACHDCRWTGPEPDEDKCPGCAGENCMAAACPECGGRYELVAEAKISTPAAQAGQMPKAWLDVQAERRRQVEAEGWTPEHDDEHDSGELAAAGAAYALHAADHLNPYSQGDGGDEAPSCWPWHDGIAGRGEGPEKTEPAWWKPSTPRRDLVKACALALAEIERLDRAAANQGGPRDA